MLFIINARGRLSLTSETKYFCYSRVRAIKFYFNGTAHEILEVVNVMNYKINVKGVVNTYPANMLKLYVQRQNVTSYRSAAIDAHCNVKSKDHRDPTVHRVTVDTVTSNNVTCGDVTSQKDSPSQVSISERDEEKSRGNGTCKICHAK